MFDSMSSMDLVAAIDATEVAVTALGDTGVDDCDASLIREQLRRLKRVESRLGAQVGRLTHAADRAGAFIGTGARDTAEWLGGQTGTSTRRNRAAAELGEAMAGSAALAGAVSSGRVSTDQASAAVGAAAGERIDDALIDEIADSRCRRSGRPSRSGATGAPPTPTRTGPKHSAPGGSSTCVTSPTGRRGSTGCSTRSPVRSCAPRSTA